MSKGTCKLDGCEKPRIYRLYCHMHQARLRKTGATGPAESSVMSTDGECSLGECGRPIRSRGLCEIHYDRRVRGRDIEAPEIRRYETPEEALAARTQWLGQCLFWTGAKNERGYGTLTVAGEFVYAHRYAWERANGPIPEGLHIDHLCRNRACVNDVHLDAVTQEENNHRMALSPEEHFALGEIRKAVA